MQLQKIKDLAKILSDGNLQEIDYEDANFKVKIIKNKQEKEEREIVANNYVKSPLVGAFFNTNPPIKIGERVKKGQVICIINSMKIMNEISSPIDGIVKDIKFSDNDVVNYNDDLILIEKI